MTECLGGTAGEGTLDQGVAIGAFAVEEQGFRDAGLHGADPHLDPAGLGLGLR